VTSTEPKPPVPGGHATHLTPREREVALLLARGLTNRQIADSLVITERTVAAHVEHILGKLGFTSRTQVALWAVEQKPLRLLSRDLGRDHPSQRRRPSSGEADQPTHRDPRNATPSVSARPRLPTLLSRLVGRDESIDQHTGIRSNVGDGVSLVGIIAVDEGALGTGLRLISAGLSHVPLTYYRPADRAQIEASLTAARSGLGDEEYARIWAEGQAMALDHAVEQAMGEIGR
jgi:DNA-binding CsgD family transcriptional regulator